MWSLRPVQHWTWARRGNWVDSRPCPRSTTDGVTVVKQLCQSQPMGFVPSFSSSFSCSFFTLFFSWLYLGRGTWSYSQTTWLISSTASMWPWNGLKHSSQNQNQKWTRFIVTFRVLERLCNVISRVYVCALSIPLIFSKPCPLFCTDACVLFCLYYLCMLPCSLVTESKLYGSNWKTIFLPWFWFTTYTYVDGMRLS